MVGLDAAVGRAIDDNGAKLGEARHADHGSRECHLAVFVEEPTESATPADDPLPPLPDDIDVVWLVMTWNRRSHRPWVWSFRRDSDAWRAHEVALDITTW